MTSILETQVTDLLTSFLGRAPTAAELANGMISPVTLAQIHNTLDVPSSLFTIGPTDDMQAAINKLSSNGGGILNLLPGTYVLLTDITIPTGVGINGAGPTNTQIIGAAGHGFVAHGSSGTHLTDIVLSNLGFYSGVSGAMVNFQYADRIIFSNLELALNNQGIIMDTCTEMNWSTVVVAQSTGDGITVTNSSLADWRSVNSEANGGVGLVLDTVSTLLLSPGDFEGNTSHGVSLNACSAIRILAECDGNGGDGIHLTASDTNKIYLGGFTGNGAYGVNITNAACDNNLILGCNFVGNTTAAANDSGTGTLIRSNLGLIDN